MDWTAAIDLYCERTSPEFWAEPLNAWSNLSFPIAALWAATAARRSGTATREFLVLAALAASVGVGSFLFHTFAMSGLSMPTRSRSGPSSPPWSLSRRSASWA